MTFDPDYKERNDFNNTSAFDFSVDSQTLSKFDFQADLKDGQKVEEFVRASLKDETIEVKFDKWALKSGNLCLEFECRGKPSGIMTTQSSRWAFVLGNMILIFPTPFLRWVHSCNLGTTKWGGDRSNNQPTTQFRLIAWKDLLALQSQYSSQTTRVVNLRNEPYDVYIGRAGHGKDGYFGNPHPVGTRCFCMQCDNGTVHQRGEAIAAYKKDFLYRIEHDPEFLVRVLELRGKRLGCFCKPLPCHGDVIKEWLDNHPNFP